MRIEITAYTAAGCALGERLCAVLQKEGEDARFRSGKGENGIKAKDWAAEYFPAADALIFIGAAGIAVRSIAPLAASKLSDPAVLVLDDGGRFAVSLLSGHVGGANDLTRRVAGITGGIPVITTATDGRGLFAIDSWAAKCGFFIANPEKIKAVSGKLLDGRQVGLWTPFPIAGELPAGFFWTETAPDAAVSVRRPVTDCLWLVPPVLTLGVGCRKDTPAEAIEAAFEELLRQTGFSEKAFRQVCSIDLKAEEPGLLAFCEKRGLPFRTFSGEELSALPGEFTPSAFVSRITGVDNVCERSAVKGSGGEIVCPKQAGGGVTRAAAMDTPALDCGR